MAQEKIKVSKFIQTLAREHYARKNGQELLTYQSPTMDCLLSAMLEYFDVHCPDIIIEIPDLPTIHLDEPDHQPRYRKK